MIVEHWSDALPLPAARTSEKAAAIGVFDGFHRGHAALIKKISESPYMPTVFTFTRNPKKLTKPDLLYDSLFSSEQKLEAFEAVGIRLCVLIDFSSKFSKLSGTDFISTLVKTFHVRYFAIGSNFACGYKLGTKADAFQAAASSLGASVNVMDPVDFGGLPVSSSRIRAAVAEGRMDEARAMLGRPYTLDVRGADITERGGCCSLMAASISLIMPPNGIYAAELITQGVRHAIRLRIDTEISWLDALLCRPDFIAVGSKIEE